jgi:hypothetical protein
MFLIFGLLLAACTSKQPRIALETDRILFGDVVNGEVVGQDIAVQNAGDGPLVVAAISTSCGCTQATLDPMTIQPAGSAILHVEFDSGAHGPALNGPMLRQIFIASNDPEQPEVVIELTANVLAQAPP